jgi:hypothetical protein
MSRQFTPHDSPDESPRIPLVDASRETIRTILAVAGRHRSLAG